MKRKEQIVKGDEKSDGWRDPRHGAIGVQFGARWNLEVFVGVDS